MLSFMNEFSSVLYLVSLLSLVGLFIFGKTINGATSWYNFGALSLQPSEFMKAFTALAVAKLISDRQYNFKLIKNQIKAFIIIFAPAFLITLQPDVGSALIYIAFFLCTAQRRFNFKLYYSRYFVNCIVCVHYFIWCIGGLIKFTCAHLLFLHFMLFIKEESASCVLIGIKY